MSKTLETAGKSENNLYLQIVSLYSANRLRISEDYISEAAINRTCHYQLRPEEACPPGAEKEPKRMLVCMGFGKDDNSLYHPAHFPHDRTVETLAVRERRTSNTAPLPLYYMTVQ